MIVDPASGMYHQMIVQLTPKMKLDKAKSSVNRAHCCSVQWSFYISDAPPPIIS